MTCDYNPELERDSYVNTLRKNVKFITHIRSNPWGITSHLCCGTGSNLRGGVQERRQRLQGFKDQNNHDGDEIA